MNYQVITVKVDPTTKKEAQYTADELGLSLSAVLKGLLRQFIQTKTVRFSAMGEKPNEYLLSAMKRAKENRKTGKASPVFDNAKDALKFLDEQGI